MLIVEEGQPEYLEQAINTVLRRRDIQARVHGKDVLPMGGDYTAQVLLGGIREFLEKTEPRLLGNRPPAPDDLIPQFALIREAVRAFDLPCLEQAGFEVITAPMGYLSAGYERPLGGWLPESRVIWQSSLLLNEAIGLLAYPIVHGKQ